MGRGASARGRPSAQGEREAQAGSEAQDCGQAQTRGQAQARGAQSENDTGQGVDGRRQADVRSAQAGSEKTLACKACVKKRRETGAQNHGPSENYSPQGARKGWNDGLSGAVFELEPG